MTPEMLAKLKAMGISEEILQDPAELKALVEKVELENKSEKIEDKAKSDKEIKEKTDKEKTDKEKAKSEEIHNNQLERLAKAISKRENKTQDRSEFTELDIDNRVFIKSDKLSEDKVNTLKEFSQLASNKGKSYEEIANTLSVKAVFDDLDQKENATIEIDANADEETILSTKNEIFDKYSKNGKEPTTEYEKKVVATEELERAGFKDY